MDLTPDQVTDLIIRAFQRGVEHGKALAEEKQGTSRLYVRPGTYTYAADPIAKPRGPFGVAGFSDRGRVRVRAQ